MRARKNRDTNIFSLSFLDVLANSIGSLAFLLVLALLMTGGVVSRQRHPVLPLKVLTSSLPAAMALREYCVFLAADGGVPPYSWSVQNSVPGWLRAAAPGSWLGRPTIGDVGETAVVFTVSDAAGHTARTQPLRLEVLSPRDEAPLPLKVTSLTLPTLLTGRPAEVTLACEGGGPPYRWTVEGPIEGGLRSEGARIVGTPTEAGSRDLALSVRDSTGQTASVQLPLRVERMAPQYLVLLLLGLLAAALVALVLALLSRSRAGRAPLRILTETVPNARASCDYTVHLAALGGAPPYNWRLIGGDLPPGMTLTAEGKLSGRPFEGIGVDVTREARFTVEVRDKRGGRAVQEL